MIHVSHLPKPSETLLTDFQSYYMASSQCLFPYCPDHLECFLPLITTPPVLVKRLDVLQSPFMLELAGVKTKLLKVGAVSLANGDNLVIALPLAEYKRIEFY